MSRRVSGRLAGLLVPVLALWLLPLTARASSSPAPEAPSSNPATIAAIPLDEAVTRGGLVMRAHAETLRPAPLPDPDVRAPGPGDEALASQADPRFAPDFFNPNAHVVGDGYAAGSAIETDHNNRHSAGGGMSLSIPMR